MIFSELTQQLTGDLNRFSVERERLEKKDVHLIDLVSGNVSANGIQFPATLLKRILGKAAARTRSYRPHPLGLRAAREAISDFYARQGTPISAQQILLTPGTSLAYLYLFLALADPGDEILCPSPGYPLFDMIASTAHVHVSHYRLRERERWTVDFDSLRSAITPRTRAIILVSPHNPTGAVATEAELGTLAGIAREYQLAIIADEVFAAFLFGPAKFPRIDASVAPLVFLLNGFSKMFALPGLKLAWVAACGEPEFVHQSLSALELISDSFLPVNEAAQEAVPLIFKNGSAFLQTYQAEVRRRTEYVLQKLSTIQRIRFIRPEGGFYVSVRLPGLDEETVCLDLLKRHHTIVHPGYFYDIEGSHLVISTVHRRRQALRGLSGLAEVLK